MQKFDGTSPQFDQQALWRRWQLLAFMNWYDYSYTQINDCLSLMFLNTVLRFLTDQTKQCNEKFHGELVVLHVHLNIYFRDDYH